MAYFVEGISQRTSVRDKVPRIGEYRTAAEAIAAAQNVVDVFLSAAFKPGMDADSLFSVYRLNAVHPYIFRDDGDTFNVPGFNHDQYAKARAIELCKANK